MSEESKEFFLVEREFKSSGQYGGIHYKRVVIDTKWSPDNDKLLKVLLAKTWIEARSKVNSLLFDKVPGYGYRLPTV